MPTYVDLKRMEPEKIFTIGQVMDLGVCLFEVAGFGRDKTLFLRSLSRRADCCFGQGDKIDLNGWTGSIRSIADKGRLLHLMIEPPKQKF